jgi:hypothetical protein
LTGIQSAEPASKPIYQHNSIPDPIDYYTIDQSYIFPMLFDARLMQARLFSSWNLLAVANYIIQEEPDSLLIPHTI